MIAYLKKKHTSLPYRILSGFIAFTFTFSLVLPPSYAQLLPQTVLNLPVPGTRVPPSTGFAPALMTGVTIHPDNPLRFDFIMDRGQSGLAGGPLKEEYTKMIKYFMASLTVPEDELWVNLSPYEKDRMIADGLGKTEMGRDMLAQDYLLKQLTASLMYPEKELGKTFWDRVYKKAQEQFGTTEIPVNTFNKVWIVPDEAVVYEQGTSAFVIKSRLAVMLEEDYEAMNSNVGNRHAYSLQDDNQNTTVPSEIIREIIIPEIEKEVNEGANFANLRQIYNALILATWYKQRLKDSLLGKVYVNRNKTRGIDTRDKEINQKIYNQYIESFQKGVYNFIKEDYDPATQEITPRKYFSGGMNWKLGLKTLGAFALGTWLGFGEPDVGNAQVLAAAMGGNKDGVTTEFVDNANPRDIGTAITVKEGVQPILLAQATQAPGGGSSSSPVFSKEDISHAESVVETYLKASGVHMSQVYAAGIALNHLDRPSLRLLKSEAEITIKVALEADANPFGGNEEHYLREVIAAGTILDHPDIPYFKPLLDEAERILSFRFREGSGAAQTYAASVVLDHLDRPAFRALKDRAKIAVVVDLEAIINPFGGNEERYLSEVIAAGAILRHPEIEYFKISQSAAEISLEINSKPPHEIFGGGDYRSTIEAARLVLNNSKKSRFQTLQDDVQNTIGAMLTMRSGPFGSEEHFYMSKAIAAGAVLDNAKGASSPVEENRGQGIGDRVQKEILRDTSDEIQTTKKVGGIDLNPALLNLQIRRDGNGVPLPLPMQPIENMHIDGFLPVIINIVPIVNLPLLLGLDLPPQEEAPVRLTYQQLSLATILDKEWFSSLPSIRKTF